MHRQEFGFPDDPANEDDLPEHLKKNHTKETRHTVTFMDKVTKNPKQLMEIHKI